MNIVPQALATQAATAWINKQGLASARTAVTTIKTVDLDDGYPGIHLVSDGTTSVLVAGDQEAQPILGWAASSDLQNLSGDQPPALQDMLASWGQQILSIRQSPPARTSFQDKWNSLLNPSVRAEQEEPVKEIAPILTTRWGQGAGWNAYCPADAAGPAGRTYAGCVATAMAQVLYHHKHPWRGKNIQSYWHEDYGDISVIYSDETPQWDLMQAVGSTPATARLLFIAGVSVRMNYGPRSSTASTSNIPTALRGYFRYQDTARAVWRSSIPPEAWEALIQEELQANRPIIHRGQGSRGGHAFNLDGWRSDGFKHLNFGWNGSYNGWYTLDDITPGAYDFTNTQAMVVGIQPVVEQMLFPRDGDVNIAPGAVFFRWVPKESMTKLELEVAINAQFTERLKKITLEPSASKFTFIGALPSTQYFWRLIWTDKSNNRRVSEVCTFKTGTQPTTGPGGRPAIVKY